MPQISDKIEGLKPNEIYHMIDAKKDIVYMYSVDLGKNGERIVIPKGEYPLLEAMPVKVKKIKKVRAEDRAEPQYLGAVKTVGYQTLPDVIPLAACNIQ